MLLSHKVAPYSLGSEYFVRKKMVGISRPQLQKQTLMDELHRGELRVEITGLPSVMVGHMDSARLCIYLQNALEMLCGRFLSSNDYELVLRNIVVSCYCPSDNYLRLHLLSEAMVKIKGYWRQGRRTIPH